jgi:(p)ppGpp synthase/HD superfamily hydrolase
MKEQARNFAIASHGDQKYGSHPYSVHLDAVAKIARPFGETAETIAYLHDVVEDTEVTLEEVKAQFGKLVADAVAILTDELGENRKERKSKTYAKMANVIGETEIALVVKAADRLANMRACVADKNQDLLAVYKSEHPVFRESVFRSDACNEIWSELEKIFNA